MNTRQSMTNKERSHAALEGKPVDRCPVTSLYSFLYFADHFHELTGLPAWRLQEWTASSPEAYADRFAQIQERVPLEILQPHHWAPSPDWIRRQEFVIRDGAPFRHDRGTGEWVPLDARTASGHASDYHANETQFVCSRQEAAERTRVTPAERQIADGGNAYIDAIVRRFGSTEFILSGGVIGTLYSCHSHVGLTNLFAMLIEAPDLIEYLSQKILEQNIETIRRFAAAGGDAIYIDDATATCDMISVAHYERFSLPYMREMVKEIHRLGQKAILIYFGGVSDRLDQIASIGADGLLFEASMKGYVNDVAEIAGRIGDRVTVFGNLDSIRILQDGTAAELEIEIRRQIEAGRKARGFILSPASPITPSTPLSRVQRYIELGRRYGVRRP